MTPLFWLMFWSVLPPSTLLCCPDSCNVDDSSSLHNMSPPLKSVQCHNDYMSYVHCKWREHRNTTLQLWFDGNNGDNREQCVRHGPEELDTSEHRTVHCRHKTDVFARTINHTVFFLKNGTLSPCSTVPHKPLDLSQHLRARPPQNLSTHGAGDGGRRLRWSSPYPSSSSLSRNITYQLSYRTDRQDNWTSEDVTNTSVKLEKRLLLPGCRYEARVRARASVGQWSNWSPVVTWHTAADTGQIPSVHCVLDGEKEVTCSWEVNREVAHFITYQLACRHNQAAPSERCCVNPAVSSDHSRAALKYSCSMTVADPARLLIELQPAHAAKTFVAFQHVHPKPPQQVKVREELDRNWIVAWTEPSKALELGLRYQVCYYRMQDQGSSVLLNTSQVFVGILGASLAPSQRYQVMVRSLVGPDCGGIPSEWTDPVEWTSHEATWSLSTLIYSSISVFVAAVFLTLYCTIPACQRRAVLWVDSVPSPGKSKILSEIKSTTSRCLMQSESTTICKVLRMDSVSTCSSDALLWPTKDTEKKYLEQDEGCWTCDNLLSPAKKVNVSDTSALSFSGPYIFCQSPEPGPKSVDVKCEENEREEEPPSDDCASHSSEKFTLFGDGYVCLPGRSVSRSTQDLTSHSDINTNTNTQRHDDIAEQDQQCPEKMAVQPGLSEPTSSHQLPANTSGPFTAWPQGGATQASGYCHLPPAFMGAAK
ncbi:cytokine receptor common subunit beta [Centropristis striata]|uniref:cytokine receptor common subunit beta n=1 Tax=Centropristis striata TaxID=184440 RepID=UPI0027E07764|nr:cytokine receptor common subunit beta [Centropristis striata]